MDELMKNLKEAYDLLRLIPVSDTAVDAMYAARVKMRKAFQLAEALEAEKAVAEND